jgi:hypothetical protein
MIDVSSVNAATKRMNKMNEWINAWMNETITDTYKGSDLFSKLYLA